VTGHGEHHGSAAELQDVLVGYLVVDPAGRGRLQVRRDDGVQPLLGRREGGGRAGPGTTHEGGVRMPCHHSDVGPSGDVGRGAGVVVVEVGEHDAPQLLAGQAQLFHRLLDGRAAAGRSGVDQGGPAFVVPQVGVADAQRQQVQAGDHVDDVHDLTLGRSGDASA